MTAPTQYEFSDQQNGIIGSLGKNMGDLGAFMQVIGVLYAVGAAVALVRAVSEPITLGQGLVALATAAFYFLIGGWTRTAGASFKQVVATEGEDVSHLMRALDNLRKLYRTMVIVIKVMIVVMIIGLAAALMLPQFLS